MNAPARLTMEFDRYVEWEKNQERKHEFVDGVITLMAGGTAAHNAIAVNVIVALSTRLRGGPCKPFGSGMKVLIPAGNVRYPDVTIDCGKPKPGDLWAAEPRAIVDVLSQNRRFGRVWTRDGSAWKSEDAEGDSAMLAFPAIDADVLLSEAYDGVEFAPAES